MHSAAEARLIVVVVVVVNIDQSGGLDYFLGLQDCLKDSFPKWVFRLHETSFFIWQGHFARAGRSVLLTGRQALSGKAILHGRGA